MPTYVSLLRYTSKGMDVIKDSPQDPREPPVIRDSFAVRTLRNLGR